MNNYQLSNLCALRIFYYCFLILNYKITFGQLPLNSNGPQISPAAVPINNPAFGPKNIQIPDNPQVFTGTSNNLFYGGKFIYLKI